MLTMKKRNKRAKDLMLEKMLKIYSSSQDNQREIHKKMRKKESERTSY